MSDICDIVFEAFKLIANDGEKFLDKDFMLKMYSPLYEQLPELQQFLEWFFQERKSYPVGVKRNGQEWILVIDETVAELFYPLQAANWQTNDFCSRVMHKK